MRQEDPTTGITQDKEALRDELEDLIREIGDAVYAYASKKGDHALAAQVEIKMSELDRMSDQRVDDVAVRVHSAAAANLAALGDYNVDQAKLDALDAARVAFQGTKSKPRVKIAEKAGETKTLPGKIRAVKTVLRTRLDKLMTGFRKTDPEFYAGYLAARVIVDRRGPGGDEETPTPTPTPTP